jgi:hypothetical protein
MLRRKMPQKPPLCCTAKELKRGGFIQNQERLCYDSAHTG